MPEYFDVSLLARKTYSAKTKINNCLNEYKLFEGENEESYFGKRKVVVSYFEDEQRDFLETCISFSDQIFHKNVFERELDVYTNFISRCFASCNDVEFALCSYELNGYLLSKLDHINEINNELLQRFPIVYKRSSEQPYIYLSINLNAQEILI